MSGTGMQRFYRHPVARALSTLPSAGWHRRTSAPAREARQAPRHQGTLLSFPPSALRAVLEQHPAGVEILANPIGFAEIAALAGVLAGVDQALDLVDRDR